MRHQAGQWRGILVEAVRKRRVIDETVATYVENGRRILAGATAKEQEVHAELLEKSIAAAN
jgi:hypothetical protein